MKKRIIICLLSAVLLLTLAACSKEDDSSTDDAQNPSLVNATNEYGENVDAWWQQYTTEPHLNDGSTSSGTVAASGNTTEKNRETSKSTTKAGAQVTGNKTTTKVVTATAKAEEYTKVDSDTMKYEVKNGNDKGVVTLTKSASNKYIKDALKSINDTFSSNFVAANTMCYSSTLNDMKDTTLVYVFSGSKKDASTLRFVVQFKGDTPKSFGKITVEGVEAPLYYWPCAVSGDAVYTEYLNTFKQVAGDYYSSGTETYKELLKDECVNSFLSWK